MAGLPWIKVATDVVEHPKVDALAVELAEPVAAARGYVLATWCFFARFYPEGAMLRRGASSLERFAGWSGAAGRLVTAMLTVGLLEGRRDRLRVHDWDVYQGAHIDKSVRDRARVRLNRKGHRAAKPPESHEDGRAAPARKSRGEGEERKTTEAPPLAPLPEHAQEQVAEPLALTPDAPPRGRGTARKSKAGADPRHAPLVEALVGAYRDATGSPYPFQGGKDGAAVKRLLSCGTDDEILARWRYTLGLPAGFYGVRSIATLASRWTDLAPEIDRLPLTSVDPALAQGLRLIGEARASGASTVDLPEPPGATIGESWLDACLLHDVRPAAMPLARWDEAKATRVAACAAAKASLVEAGVVGPRNYLIHRDAPSSDLAQTPIHAQSHGSGA